MTFPSAGGRYARAEEFGQAGGEQGVGDRSEGLGRGLVGRLVESFAVEQAADVDADRRVALCDGAQGVSNRGGDFDAGGGPEVGGQVVVTGDRRVGDEDV